MNELEKEIQQLTAKLNQSRVKGRFYLLSLLVQLFAFIGFVTETFSNRPDIAFIWLMLQLLGLLLMMNNRRRIPELLEIIEKLKRLEELQNRDQK